MLFIIVSMLSMFLSYSKKFPFLKFIDTKSGDGTSNIEGSTASNEGTGTVSVDLHVEQDITTTDL